MTLTVTEMALERRGSETTQGRTSTRVFHVITDDPTTCEADIYDNASIPNIFDVHPDDATIICHEVAPEMMDDRLHWRVVCTYAPPNKDLGTGATVAADEPAADGRGEVISPTDLPCEISLGTSFYSRVADNAYDAGDDQNAPSLAIENSAGMPFDPPLMKEDVCQTIQIVRNETLQEYNPSETADYVNTVNSVATSIAGISIGVAEGRMAGISSVRMRDAVHHVYYYRVTYNIEVNRNGYRRRVLDQGLYTFEPDKEPTPDTAPVTIKDEQGMAINEPRKLNGAGGLLGSEADPVYLTFKTMYESSWNGLNLPTSKDSN